jgi:DNA-directed RNA polymerase specialized sigma24 family protein
MNDENIKALTRRARRALRDDDLAQEAVLATYQAPPGADCGRYFSGTIRRLKSDAIAAKIAQRKITEIDENHVPPETYSLVDWQLIPDGLKQIARDMLAGFTIQEIAVRQGIAPSALRMQLARHRKKIA